MAEGYHASMNKALFDGAMEFMDSGSGFDQAQYAAAGNSPAFSQGAFQINPIVPMKRSRNMQDGRSESPAQSLISESRVQGPGSTFADSNAMFAGVASSMGHPTPNQMAFNQAMAYQQLQNNGSDGSPSPMSANHPQRFSGGQMMAQGQRTISPNSFSPASVGFSSHQQTEPRARIGTPSVDFNPTQMSNSAMLNTHYATDPTTQQMQSINQHRMSIQGLGTSRYQSGLPQGLGATSTSAIMVQATPNQNKMPLAHAQMHAARVQAQQRQLQQTQGSQAHARQQHMRSQQIQQQQRQQQQAQRMMQAHAQDGMMAPEPTQDAMHSLSRPVGQTSRPPLSRAAQDIQNKYQNYMAQHGTPADLTPIICGQQVPFWAIWQIVIYRYHGSAKVQQGGLWPMVAQLLRFDNSLQAAAGAHLQRFWVQQVQAFESVFITAAGNQRSTNPQDSAAIIHQQRHAQSMMERNQVERSQTQRPNSRINIQDPGQEKTIQLPPRTPSQAIGPSVTNPSSGQMASPGVGQQARRTASTQSLNQPVNAPEPSGSDSIPQLTSEGAVSAVEGSPNVTKAVPQLDSSQSSALRPHGTFATPTTSRSRTMPANPERHQVPTHYTPLLRQVNADEIAGIDRRQLEPVVRKIEGLRPVAPLPFELGVIDIHALSKSIESGLQREVRVALETLITITGDRRPQLAPIDLTLCDDLVESMLGGLEDAVDDLVDNVQSPIRPGPLTVKSYESLLQSVEDEQYNLVESPVFDTPAYRGQRAASLLTAFLDIFRNLSFPTTQFDNARVLGPTRLLSLFKDVLRIMVFSNEEWYKDSDRLIQMKNMILIMSNTVHESTVGDSEDAAALLHLVLAFAPNPEQAGLDGREVIFPRYDHEINPFLPAAIDALTKLLAKDAASHGHVKQILTSSPALMTRTFGMTVACIPKYSQHVWPQLQDREAVIQQSMLAAAMVIDMIASSDAALAKSWLCSADSWASNLYQIIAFLSASHQAPNGQHTLFFHAFSSRAIGVLRSLAELAKLCELEGTDDTLPLRLCGLVPPLIRLMRTMSQPNMDMDLGNQLVAYSEVCRSSSIST